MCVHYIYIYIHTHIHTCIHTWLYNPPLFVFYISICVYIYIERETYACPYTCA